MPDICTPPGVALHELSLRAAAAWRRTCKLLRPLRRPAVFVGRALPYLGVVAVLVVYGVLQVRTFTPAYTEVDPDGYLVLAKRMARGEPLAQKPKNLFLYQTHVWVENDEGLVTPKFAPGYPALMAVAYRWFGDEGMFYVSPFFGGLALIGMWLLLMQWMKPWPCFLAVACVGLSRMYLYYNGYLLTHATNICFVTWGMCFLWKWLRNPGPVWGTAAGLCLGFSVTVRHTSAVLALAIAVALISRLIQDRKTILAHWRGEAALVLSYAVFPLLLCAYDDAVFGGMFKTGYSFSDEQAAFSLTYFVRNFSGVVKGLNSEVLPPALTLGLIGMVMLGDRTERLVRIAWFVPLFIVYVSYYWVVESWAYLRFFLCAAPMLVGTGYLLVTKLEVGKAARAAGLLLLFGVMFGSDYPALKQAYRRNLYGNNNRKVAEAARILSETLKPDAVVFTRQPMQVLIGTRERFEYYDLAAFEGRSDRRRFRANDRGRREYHPRRQQKRTERFRQFYDTFSNEQRLRMKRDIVEDALKGGRQVVFFLQQGQQHNELGKLGEGFELTLLKEWEFYWDYWRGGHMTKWALYEVKPRAAEGM